jgi:hypothetical protein
MKADGFDALDGHLKEPPMVGSKKKILAVAGAP